MDPLSALRALNNPAISQLPLPADAAQAQFKDLPMPQVGEVPSLREIDKTGGLSQVGGPGMFDKVLGNLVRDVTAKSAVAGDALRGVMAGENVSLHQAMIAMEESSVSFQLMVEVRNKLLESYQELMRMQM